MSPHHRTKLLHVIIEYFFAVLPLPLLAVIGFLDTHHRAMDVLVRPDMVIVSTILYGLALIRFVQSIPSITSRIDVHGQSARVLIVVLWPLLGLTASAATIALFEAGAEPSLALWWNVGNFVLASTTFIILAGYGSTRSKGE
jgi:hypothetical protein